MDAEDFRQVRAAVRQLVRDSVVPREEQIEDEDRIPDDLRTRAKGTSEIQRLIIGGALLREAGMPRS